MLKIEISTIFEETFFGKKDFIIQNIGLGNLYNLLILGHPKRLEWIRTTIKNTVVLSVTLPSPARKVGIYGSV